LTNGAKVHILLKTFSENAFKTTMTPKSRPPTIADVARQAQVSIATVSRVLNGTTPVQPEKADRVRMAMDELQFVPRHAARVLASKRTNTIGLLLPEISGAFFPPMLKGIEAGAHEAGYDLLIHSTQQQGRARHQLGEHNTDGLLVFTNSLAARELHRLYNMDFPWCFCTRPRPIR
jgi:LacI family transcriptional regulator